MRLAQQDQTGKWAVFYNGQPIAISGHTQFETRDDAVSLIAQRGLVVKDDGDIFRPVAPVVFRAPEPAPIVLRDDAPSFAAGTEVIEEPDRITLLMDPTVTEDDIEPLPPVDPQAVKEAVESLRATIRAAAEAEVEKIPEPSGKRGRPRTYTVEEAAERRREQNRKYYHERQERRRREVAERSREWWESHPEKVEEYREKANSKRRSRYQNDPEYRAKVAAYNREYQAKKRAEKAAEAAKPAEE
jgi:hypothetical protein